MYGQRPARRAELAVRAGRGRLRRLLRPAQPRASTSRTCCVGPIARVVGDARDVHHRAAAAAAGRPRTTAAAAPATRPAPSPTRTTSARSSIFANGARGTFESSRTMVGPESQMAFDVYGTKGALSWNLERLNELRVYRAGDGPDTGYTTRLRRRSLPVPRQLRPGQRERDRVRGPDRDRGLRVPERGRARRAVRAGLRRSASRTSPCRTP